MPDFIFDTETLGTSADSVIVSAAFLVFDLNKEYTFNELVNNALYVKFDIKEQRESGRFIDSNTVAWWKKQSKEAQIELLPSKKDVSMLDGINKIKEYLNNNGIHNSKDVCGWCRGTSFDFPLMYNLHKQNNTTHYWMCDFWNERDVRSYIAGTLGAQTISKIPLPQKILNEKEFIAHNCTHDIVKDVLMMQYAKKIAYGEEDLSK